LKTEKHTKLKKQIYAAAQEAEQVIEFDDQVF